MSPNEQRAPGGLRSALDESTGRPGSLISVPAPTDNGEDEGSDPAWDGVWGPGVRTPQGRTRRRVVLCQLRPIFDVTPPEPSVVEVALRAAGFTVTDDDGTPLDGAPR